MMKWNQISIQTTEDAADIVSSILLDAGAGGIEMDGGSLPDPIGDELPADTAYDSTVCVKAYYGEQDFARILASIKDRLSALKEASDSDMGTLDISTLIVADTDWNENFKKNFTTFRAAGNIVIKPTWEDYDAAPDDIVIEMDPGMAFGSGDHETTKMCLSLAQKYMRTDASVLDVGCGSGILGIACAKLGAKDVAALDYDSTSVKVTQDNAVMNSVGNLTAIQSDLAANAPDKKFDIVLANIIADIIIRLNKEVGAYMAADAVYIMSGIIGDRLDDVLSSLASNGLSVIEIISMGDWRAVAARRRDA